MEAELVRVPAWLRYFALFGNVVYVLWILYNGVGEGFRGRPVEVTSILGLLLLLVLNSALILHKDR